MVGVHMRRGATVRGRTLATEKSTGNPRAMYDLIVVREPGLTVDDRKHQRLKNKGEEDFSNGGRHAGDEGQLRQPSRTYEMGLCL